MNPTPQPVLLVEDDPDHALLARATFRRAGLPAPVVLSGGDALAYLAREGPYADAERYPAPVLVLSDLHAGEASGLDLLAYLREHGGAGRPPAAILSGSSNPADRRRALDLGAVAFLEKPLTTTALLDLLRALELA